MPTRVLFVSPAAGLGGAERVLIDIIAGLREVGSAFEPHVLSFSDGPLLERAEAAGARVSVLPLPARLAEWGESGTNGFGHALRAGISRLAVAPELIQFLSAFSTALARIDPQIVHTNGMKAHMLARAARILPQNRRPWVLHLHDFTSARRLSRHFFRGLSRRSTLVLAISHAVADDFRVLAPKAPLSVVHNAIDTEYFFPSPGDPGWLAELSGLAPPAANTRSFGLVATYARWKGQDLFISAARALCQRNPEMPLRFYVIGGPIYATSGSQFSHAELNALISAAGLESRIGLVPFQSDVAKVYRSLNVVVHASTKPEPFGLTIVEAMSCGRPVIVARAGGAAELFTDGETALGFQPRTVDGIVNCMQRLLDDSALALSIGERARAHALAHFARQRLGREIEAAYQVLLAQSGQNPIPIAARTQ